MRPFTCLEFAFAYFNSLTDTGSRRTIGDHNELSFLVVSELTGYARRMTLTADGFWTSASKYTQEVN
jgi:hypothetical protein